MLIYVYDGTFDGLLSCVFHAFEVKKFPDGIMDENYEQHSFVDDYVRIDTDFAKSSRVYEGIIKKVSYEALFQAYTAFLADVRDREVFIFNFIKMGFTYGKKVLDMYGDENVLNVKKLCEKVNMEAQRVKGFVRFKMLEGEIYFSEIEPTHNILEILAQHFADRYPLQNWIICDKKRGITAVYNTKDWVITPLRLEDLPEVSENEEEYQKLWKTFFGAITIQERKNPKLQRQLMPKKYWKYMFEMK